MKTAILTACLVAVAFAIPVRKTGGSDSDSDEGVSHYFRRFYSPVYPRFGGNRPGYRVQPYYPNFGKYPRFPNFYPNYNNYPSYNYPTYPNYANPRIFNGFKGNYHSKPATIQTHNYVGGNGPQEYSVSSEPHALSMSSEISVEDTSSMEGTNFMIPSMNVPYDVPDYVGHVVPDYVGHVVPDYVGHVVPDYGGHVVPDYGGHVVPDYQVPGVPDDEGPIVPGVDTNSVDFGLDQTSSNELATEVTNAEEASDVFPYYDSVHNSESLGLNPDEDSMMSESDEGVSRQDLMYEPARLDFNYDETLRNEQFVAQEVSRENSDEDDQPEEYETQNIGSNPVDIDSIDLSNGEHNNGDDNDGMESNLNGVDSNQGNAADSNESDNQADGINFNDRNGIDSLQDDNDDESSEDDGNTEVDNIRNEHTDLDHRFVF